MKMKTCRNERSVLLFGSKSIHSHNREKRVFHMYEVPLRPGSQKINKTWALSSRAQNNCWHIGQRGAGHAFLHVFPEHLLYDKHWRYQENMIDSPRLHGLMLDTSLQKQARSLLKLVNTVKIAA